MVIPLRESTDYTAQAEQRSDSRAYDLSLSPFRPVQFSASRPIHSKDLTLSGAPKPVRSMSLSPAKRGLSTMQSNLSSSASLAVVGKFYFALSFKR